MWGKTGLGIVVLFALGLTSFSWSLDIGGNVGLISMDYMNDLLQEAGLRTGMSIAPLRTAFAWEVHLWPWPLLGIGVTRLAASGKLVGRDEQELSIVAYVLQGVGGFEIPFLGQNLRNAVSVGGMWSSTTGLVEAEGWGLNASFTIAWPILRFLNLNLAVKVGYRWAVVPSLKTEREELRPAQGPALDFSGFFAGLVFRWEG